MVGEVILEDARREPTIEVLLICLRQAKVSEKFSDELSRLSAHGVLKVIDFVIVKMEAEGSIAVNARTGLSESQAKEFRKAVSEIPPFDGATSPHGSRLDLNPAPMLIGVDDVGRAAEMLRPGEAALLIVVAHRWAERLGRLIHRRGVRLLEDYMLTPDILSGSGSSPW